MTLREKQPVHRLQGGHEQGCSRSCIRSAVEKGTCESPERSMWADGRAAKRQPRDLSKEVSHTRIHSLLFHGKEKGTS